MGAEEGGDRNPWEVCGDPGCVACRMCCCGSSTAGNWDVKALDAEHGCYSLAVRLCAAAVTYECALLSVTQTV